MRFVALQRPLLSVFPLRPTGVIDTNLLCSFRLGIKCRSAIRLPALVSRLFLLPLPALVSRLFLLPITSRRMLLVHHTRARPVLHHTW